MQWSRPWEIRNPTLEKSRSLQANNHSIWKFKVEILHIVKSNDNNKTSKHKVEEIKWRADEKQCASIWNRRIKPKSIFVPANVRKWKESEGILWAGVLETNDQRNWPNELSQEDEVKTDWLWYQLDES